MDGWSAPILVRELLAVYARRGSAASLPRVTPYRDYLALIARQDRRRRLRLGARRWPGWRRARGLRRGRRAVRRWRRSRSCCRSSCAERFAHRAAREQALTLNTVMQAAWGILLGRLSGRDDVVFGVTVAGRPAELAGVEHMVGLFINTLPLRMQLPPRAAAVGAAAADPGEPVAADGAPASRAWPRSSRRPAWASCSTRCWCSRTIRSTAPGLRPPRPTGRPPARPGRGPRCDALSAGADRAAGRRAAAAARLSARPVRARRASRRWAGG